MLHRTEAPVALDISVIQTLKSYALNPNFLKQLIETFEEHARTSIIELRQAESSSDIGTIARVAHRLKGSCLNVGAQQMVENLTYLENLTREDGGMGEAHHLISKLPDELEITAKALKSQLLQ